MFLKSYRANDVNCPPHNNVWREIHLRLRWDNRPSTYIFVSDYKIYLSQLAKYICFKFQNIFQMYEKENLRVEKLYGALCSLQSVFHSGLRCICFKLQNIFVSTSKNICFKFQNKFVSNFQNIFNSEMYE